MKKKFVLFAAMLMAGSLFAADARVEIAKGAENTFPLPGMTPDAENAVILTFTARSIGTQGWGNTAVLTFNGQNLNWADVNKQPRMLDRGPWLFRRDRDEKTAWFRAAVSDKQKTALLVFVGRETDKVADKRAYGNELGFAYRINVSDLAKAGANELKVLNDGVGLMVLNDVQLVKVSKTEVAEAIGMQQGPKTPYAAAVKTPAEYTQIGSAQTVDVAPNGNTSVEFSAPEVPEGKVLVLGFNSRLLKMTVAGWGYYLSVSVNGKALGAGTLLGRGKTLKMDKKGTIVDVPWFKSNLLLTFFAPYYQVELDPRVKEHREAGFDFFLNIQDCVKPGEKVTVSFGNTDGILHVGLRDVRLLLLDKDKLPELLK